MPLPDMSNTIRLVQRNAQRKVVIQDVGPQAVALIRMGEGQLKGQGVEVIFPPRVMEAINEFVSFELGGADVAEVLRKVMRMTLKGADGHEHAVDIRIDCTGVDGMDPVYDLRVTPSMHQRAKERPISDQMLAQAHGGDVLDPQLHIPDRATFRRIIELALHVINRDETAAVIGIILVGPHSAQGTDLRLLQQAASLSKQCMRKEDVVARLSERALGFMLLDTNKEKGAVALRRMRDALAAMNITDAGAVQFLIACDDISNMDTADALLTLCDHFAQRHPPQPVGGVNVAMLR